MHRFNDKEHTVVVLDSIAAFRTYGSVISIYLKNSEVCVSLRYSSEEDAKKDHSDLTCIMSIEHLSE